MKKRGQLLGMSFQTIFSIILVVVILVFGFFAIKMFLNVEKQAEVSVAFSEIRELVNDAYRLDDMSETKEIRLPKQIEAVCIIKDPTTLTQGQCTTAGVRDLYVYAEGAPENLYFYPYGAAEELNSQTSWKLDCNGQPCVEIPGNIICFYRNSKNKIEIRVVKEFGNPLVSIQYP